MNSFAKRSLLLAALFAFVAPSIALADVNITPSGSTVIFDFTCFTTKHCPAQVPIDAAGAALTGAAGSPSVSALTVQGISGGQAMPVTGTFFQTTQPISAASLPLPTGAATAAGLTTINSTLGTPFQAGGSIGNTAFGATQSGAWNITNVSGTVSLPTGASTAAKQPVLGTAGSASTDVLSVQGIASMTPFLTNPGTAANWAIGATGSGVPANAGYTGINVAGNTRGATGLALGSTFSQTIAIVDASGTQITSFGGSGGTASNFGSAVPSSGTAIGASDGTNMQNPRVYDTDSGAGTQYTMGVVLRGSSSGGSVELGTSTNPVVVSGLGIAKDAAYVAQTGSIGMGLINTSAPTGGGDTTLGFVSLTTARAQRMDQYSWGGTAVGAPSAYGTSPGAVNVPGANVFVTNTALVAPTAQELHLGEIGSNQIKVQIAQTVTASAYSAGNALGGLMTIANAARISGSAGAAGTGGILAGLQLNSKAIQTGVQVDIFIFDANPTGSTCTDKTAFVLANADFDKVVGILTIPSTAANGAGWFGATTTGAVGIPTYFPISYDLASATSIYACAVVRAAITPGSTSDISFKVNLLRN